MTQILGALLVLAALGTITFLVAREIGWIEALTCWVASAVFFGVVLMVGAR